MAGIKISKIKLNPDNPRLIKDDKFKQLVKSIQDFPQMLDLRPIVVNDEMMVLGGNMRLKACEAAGLKEVPIIKAKDLTPEQQREFIIKDNLSYGEWDWEAIQTDWGQEQLTDWGLDLPEFENNIDLSNFAPEGHDGQMVRQIVLIYDAHTFERVFNTLVDISKAYNTIGDNSATVLKLIDFYSEKK